MSELFYAYQTDLPDGVGFEFFSHQHIVWLLGLFAFTLVFSLLHKELPEKWQHRLDYIISGLLILLIVVRTAYMAKADALTVHELPLQFCCVSGVVCFIHAFKHRDFLGQALYTLCLPAALVALILPDWNVYPAVSFMSIENFVYRGLLITYIMCQVCSRAVIPSFKRIWKVWVFSIIIAPPVYFFNKHFDTNYFYLNVPSDDSLLVYVTDVVGQQGYFIAYAAVAFLVYIFMDFVYNLAKPD